MKDFNDNITLPFTLKVGFGKLLDVYKDLVNSTNEVVAEKAKRILEIERIIPEFRNGFSDVSLLSKYDQEIKFVLQDVFSEVLTHNEIKFASIPYSDIIFNSSERFENIIANAGSDFDLKIHDFNNENRYVFSCIAILNKVYGFNFSLRRPLIYIIPDSNGIDKYYKILYNADFIEIEPTAKAPKITQEDYDLLIDNFSDIELWKQKFPPNSYEFRGFIVSNIFDVTNDSSIAQIKSKLLTSDPESESGFIEQLHPVFQSLFDVEDIKVGFVLYNEHENIFDRVTSKGISSYLLFNRENEVCTTSLCENAYHSIFKTLTFFTVSDVDKSYDNNGAIGQFKTLKEQGIKSAILAPIAYEGKLLGVLELISYTKQALNSINANRLIDVMPFISSSVLRSIEEEKNLIEAVIQQECTSIHPSVAWRFQDAAKAFLKDQSIEGQLATFDEIYFDKVYPLYGQIDVKGSSDARNDATQMDVLLQLSLINGIIDDILKRDGLLIYKQIKFTLDSFNDEVQNEFKVDTEHKLSTFIKSEIHPMLNHVAKHFDEFKPSIDEYFKSLDPESKSLYIHRKKFDDTISLINKNMAKLLDRKQRKAQQMFPHYFERFKTDGVEHNMYIGESITKKTNFSPIYLFNLRLWQLQVMCEMENEYYQNKNKYPLELDVASMVLVFSQPLTIRFRMDEKRFDVDGTYNARYEVVKKRVDKAFIKGTTERITQKGKISIVFSQEEDEHEYLRYIKFLQANSVLGEDVEVLELENLQGVTGLKALRVNILYTKKNNSKSFYTYEDLVQSV